METIKFEFFKTSDLNSSLDLKEQIKSLIFKAQKHGCLAACSLNDRTVLARADSNPDLLFRDQMRSKYGLLPQLIIGPYPEKTLSYKEGQDYSTYCAKNH